MDTITYAIVENELSLAESAVLRAFASESGSMKAGYLLLISGVRDPRTMRKVLAKLADLEIITREKSKYALKDAYKNECKNALFRAPLNARTLTIPKGIDKAPNGARPAKAGRTDIDAEASNHPLPILMTETLNVEVGNDAPGDLLCCTDEVRTPDGLEQLIAIWNRRAVKWAERYPEATSKQIKKQRGHIAWMLRNSVLLNPTGAWVDARCNHKPSKRRFNRKRRHDDG